MRTTLAEANSRIVIANTVSIGDDDAAPASQLTAVLDALSLERFGPSLRDLGVVSLDDLEAMDDAAFDQVLDDVGESSSIKVIAG